MKYCARCGQEVDELMLELEGVCPRCGSRGFMKKQTDSEAREYTSQNSSSSSVFTAENIEKVARGVYKGYKVAKILSDFLK